MSAVTSEEFLDLLKRSGLLEPETYDATLAEIKRDEPNVLKDVHQLVGEYIKRKLLTTWHVRQLMKRKYKGFYLRQYRILGHLGSGGMSSVYLGEHTVMKRRVAIKVLPKGKLNPTYLDRFAREAQAIASLDSRHVVRAYDVDRFEDVHYIVMEYFEGQNLRQLVEKEGPLDYEDAANYIRQAALGLGDAHKCGIVHRDVKPDNIVVDERGFVKILDLGLALLDENAFNLQGTMCEEDKILGTADYLAPEQALDSHNVDARADIYGLGATLYFCLVGKPPFPSGSISQRLIAHQRKEPPSIFIVRPDAPVDLVEICSNMMLKKPENRIQTMDQVAELMNRWLIRHGFAQPSDFAEEEGDDSLDGLKGINVEQDFLLGSANATEIGFERDDVAFRLSDDELNGFAQKRGENSVDLYDAAESGTSMSRIKSAARSRSHLQSDNIVLSQKTSLENALDPIELALSEIADTTKVRVPAETADSNVKSQSVPNAPNVSSQIINLSKYKEATGQQPNAARQNPAIPQRDPRTNQSGSNIWSQAPNAPYAQNVPVEHVGAQHDYSHGSTPIGGMPQNNYQNNLDQSERGPFGDWYKDVPIWFWTVAIGGYAVAIFLAGILFTLLLNLN
ncbi:MAG: serine/threonine protein kinase [Thermoguttaceae bacterium]|nr:serine/threonine protein kinase [Thermoguttaceae bacterium]MBQ2555618.1 serine/threonine protein kinase [Thermoguttaceae bacterium]MBQ4079189.1 serine/threonine protein kinase [Thermoguttaceae bacterium]